MSGRVTDDSGYALMLGDSHAASINFGFDGIGLRNVPKSKFMFFVKFQRARSQGGSVWERGIGIVAKSLDRPRVSFKTETLNQYNRKRIVQTGHDLEALSIRFHDTVLEDVQRMFEEYYAFYYRDQDAYGDNVINDVVKQQADPAGPFGYKATPKPDGFFSHISIYQIFNKAVSQFDLINPKIEQFDPDELDYGAGGSSNEIRMTFGFEGITYRGTKPFDANLAQEMGVDATQFFDITDIGVQAPVGTYTASTNRGEAPDVDIFGSYANDFLGNISGGNDTTDVFFRSLTDDPLNTFNKSTGVATVQLPLGGFGNLLKGDNIQAQGFDNPDLPIYGSPLDDF